MQLRSLPTKTKKRFSSEIGLAAQGVDQESEANGCRHHAPASRALPDETINRPGVFRRCKRDGEITGRLGEFSDAVKGAACRVPDIHCLK
jgi:hypothetical protein